MEVKFLQTFLFLTLTVSYAEALYKPGNFLVILLSIIIPAVVLIGFCGMVVFLCKNRQRIPILRTKMGSGGHQKVPQSSTPAQAPPPMMPPPQSSPSAPPPEKSDDAVQPLTQ